MIKVVLPKNEGVEVQIEGTDGKFLISYGKAAVKVKATTADSKGRKGTIYEERYDNGLDHDLPGEARTASDAAPVSSQPASTSASAPSAISYAKP